MKSLGMQTLWDLLPTRSSRRGRKPIGPSDPPRPKAPEPARPVVEVPRQGVPSGGDPARAKGASPEREPMAERYRRVEREMLKRYGVRVRKWRSSMSGVAWQVTYQDGTVSRLIESPRPKGPMSAAIFLHEVGHHAIGFHVYKPRCLEEFHAWRFSLETMQAEGLNVTDAVRRRMAESLWYAIEKARRRGLKRLPAELEPFDVVPERFRRAGHR